MSHWHPTVLITLTATLLAGCSKGVEEGAPVEQASTPNPMATSQPPTTAPAQTASPSPPQTAAGGIAETDSSDDPTQIALLGLTAPKPETWEPAPPENSMQNARYVVPGDAGPATLVIFFFGPGMGGSVQANIDRWAGQYQSAEGGPVEPRVDEFEANGMDITFVELRGTYLGMGTSAPEQETLFLSGIVEAPVGRVFIRLVGPSETVEANREAFMALLEGLEAG